MPPDEKPTVEMNKDEITRQLLDKVLSKLTEVGDSQGEFREGMTTLSGKVDECLSGLSSVSGDVTAIKAEQVQIREWKGAVEERFNSHSMRAKTESVHDDTQDTKLQELENRLALQAKSSMREIIVEMKAAAEVVAKDPLGQKVLRAGGYALLALFGFATLYLGAMTARLQGQPPPTIVVQQATPITIDADAGAVK